MWPRTIVLQLSPKLPEGFTVEPRVHLGSFYEIDICAFDHDEARSATTAIDPTEQYAYEVLVFDQERNRQLVAAVEIVSPANKDRPEARRALVAKCAALLQQKVCVSIVDLVTIRRFNLYADVLELLGQTDPSLSHEPPATYAVTCRSRRVDDRSRFETWVFPLIVGQSLPTLPIWLTDEARVMLDLESSYEEACRLLRIS